MKVHQRKWSYYLPWLHTFPRVAPSIFFLYLAPVACCPAPDTGYRFSRVRSQRLFYLAWRQLQVCRTSRHQLHVFPPLDQVTYLPGLGTGTCCYFEFYTICSGIVGLFFYCFVLENIHTPPIEGFLV